MTGDQRTFEAPKKLTQQLDMEFALQAAGLGVWEINPTTNQVCWDERCQALVGLQQTDTIPLQQAIQYIHPDDLDHVLSAIRRATTFLAGGRFDETYRTVGADEGKLRWVRFWGKAEFTPTGELHRFSGIAQEVTEQVLFQQALQQSEQRFRRLADSLPQAIWVTDEKGTTEFLNQWWVDYSGIPFDASTAWQIAIDSLHPEDGPRLVAAFQQAMQTGSPFEIEQRNRSASGEYRWFLNKGQPSRDPQTGQLTKWVGMSVDIHERKRAERALQQSEARFRNLIEHSPTATVVFTGRDMRVQLINEPMRQIWHKDEPVVGQTLYEAMPELRGGPFLDLLQGVYDTGVAYHNPQGKVAVLVDGKLQDFWFNFAYNALYDEAGHIYGVINTAADITQQVAGQRALEDSEAAGQNAIELAELGTWQMDCQTGVTHLSPRHATIFGLELTLLSFEQAFAIVHPDDRERVRAAFEAAMQPTSNHHYEAEYRIIHGHTGQPRHIRARGQTRFDEAGQPVSIAGTTQDVTLEREAQLLLEAQVYQRTQALQLANADLQRSNDNLQQFAYIASHDLQEPLRKIQSFSTLLEQQLTDQLTPEGKQYLHRISSAGARMSTLIKDLLAYSRIATRQQVFGLVSLEAILDQVCTTLEWVMAERGAQLVVDELPVVRGDETQLSQLFQNLLANAIKFTPVGQMPQIQIQCFQRERHELPAQVRPTSDAARFIQISIHDQGIGFDVKYLDRIFQVFQRLHGKNEFAGTGVGLAICQRVVENHGGAITADSKPGNGATFCVYLPA